MLLCSIQGSLHAFFPSYSMTQNWDFKNEDKDGTNPMKIEWDYSSVLLLLCGISTKRTLPRKA